MKRTRIKICGITTIEAALAVAASGADAIGLVFVEHSPRCVTLDRAAAIIEALPAFVEPIGLFADAPVETIRRITSQLQMRTIQMHGKESFEDALAVAPLRVIKAVPFATDTNGKVWHHWRSGVSNVSALLVDSPPPVDSTITGGHGEVFDWNVMAASTHHQRIAGMAPIILAGGLTPRNVAQAIRTVAPYAVDVSSGVESSRGIKDLAKIHAFCDAVRQADATP